MKKTKTSTYPPPLEASTNNRTEKSDSTKKFTKAYCLCSVLFIGCRNYNLFYFRVLISLRVTKGI